MVRGKKYLIQDAGFNFVEWLLLDFLSGSMSYCFGVAEVFVHSRAAKTFIFVAFLLSSSDAPLFK